MIGGGEHLRSLIPSSSASCRLVVLGEEPALVLLPREPESDPAIPALGATRCESPLSSAAGAISVAESPRRQRSTACRPAHHPSGMERLPVVREIVLCLPGGSGDEHAKPKGETYGDRSRGVHDRGVPGQRVQRRDRPGPEGAGRRRHDPDHRPRVRHQGRGRHGGDGRARRPRLGRLQGVRRTLARDDGPAQRGGPRGRRRGARPELVRGAARLGRRLGDQASRRDHRCQGRAPRSRTGARTRSSRQPSTSRKPTSSRTRRKEIPP